MPTRILRDGILTSARVASLSWEVEVFYRRLMSVADDYGLYDARLPILRSALYPLQLDKMSECNIQRCLTACEAAGLILLYSHDGKPFLMIQGFGQQGKTLPKWPLPEGYETHKVAEKRYELRRVVTSRNESLRVVTYAESDANAKTDADAKAVERLNQSASVHSDVGVTGDERCCMAQPDEGAADPEPYPTTPQEVLDFASSLPLTERPRSAFALERSCIAFGDWLAEPLNRRRVADWRMRLRSWLKQDALREAERSVNKGTMRRDANTGRRYS